jgi:hypothetical protein
LNGRRLPDGFRHHCWLCVCPRNWLQNVRLRSGCYPCRCLRCASSGRCIRNRGRRRCSRLLRRKLRTGTGRIRGRGPCSRRWWRRTFGARHRQRIGLRQCLALRQRVRSHIRRLRRIRRGNLPNRRARCTRLCGRVDRCARRRWQFALLDQRGPLCDRGWQRRRSAFGGRQRIGSTRPRRCRLVDDGVDDGRIVDVGVDDVVRRRRNVNRRSNIDRNRHE